MASAVCSHCLGAITSGEAVFEDAADGATAFCCPACRSIYHLIRNEGLGGFYEKREGWRPGRPEPSSLPPAPVFQVRADGGEAEADLVIFGLRCSSCVWLIERLLSKTPGVISARVNYATHRARVRWDPAVTGLETVLKKIAALGYRPLPFVSGARDEAAERDRMSLLIRLATAAFFTFQIMLFSVALYEGYFRSMDPWAARVIGYVLWALATPVVFYSGYPFMRNTLRGLSVGAVSMDTLVFLGSMSAYVYSVFSLTRNGEVYFDTASMIITLILFGRFLEAGARRRASEAISALMGLQPHEARLVQKTEGAGGKTSLVPVSSLSPGDLIEVIPGDTVPFDCEVLEGDSEVDESMLTGEPLPVFKGPGSEVFSGTSNLGGRLLLSIKRTGDETALSRIVRAVEDAQAGKAPVERIADRVTSWFVPAMLVVAVATFLLWKGMGVGTTPALMNAISVLVIACPCALGLATPMAVLAGSSLASREGLLLRGGDVLEALSRVDTVAFDKTGTLTTGKPELDRIISYDANEEDVIKMAASLERHSEHAIAKAIQRAAGEDRLYPASRFKAVAGKGVEGTLNGRHALLGNDRFLREQGVPIKPFHEEGLKELSSTGGTVVGLALGGRLHGWLSVNDSLRPETPEAVRALKAARYGVVLLTGDGREAALSVAREAGIDEEDVYACMTPAEKAGIIRKLRMKGKRVLMVGDGINDAPALAEADAGAAMGKATDIAMRSAGAVLMREDLGLVGSLLRISARTFQAIKQNLFWAFSYNAVAVPLAAMGKIHPAISAGLMAASSIVVAGNSLKLRAGGNARGRPHADPASASRSLDKPLEL